MRIAHSSPVWRPGLVAAVLAAPQACLAAGPVKVQVTLAERVAQQALDGRPVSGRLYLFLSERTRPDPMFGPNWFSPEPFFGLKVDNLQGGHSVDVDDSALGFPGPMSALPAGDYRVQAVLDQSFETHRHALGAGNFYSDVAEWKFDPRAPAGLHLRLDRVVAQEPFPETESVKQVVVESRLLSAFHERPVFERAAVVLPAGYDDEPDRRYPVVYMIPGFGGSQRDASRYAGGPPQAEPGEAEFIRVMLSGDCRWGHHVYADSATNGPRGQALVQETIPHIDASFRTIAEPTARFLTGHSSGGWASLWLQITWPDVFGGVWSTSPDPVDFRDWQQVNLYADPPLSLYVHERGARRPIARRGTKPVLWYDSFAQMDDVLGEGGQLRSFEAVFSPLDEHGLPRKLWDRATGRVDPEVARAWQKYDIRLELERHWPELAPKLRGKLHITTGEFDTFYLEGAVELLAQTLAELDSDAEITIVSGADHGSLLTAQLYARMRRQMSEAFLRHHHDAVPQREPEAATR